MVGEEPALRPAASRAVRSAARSLTDGEQSLTAESALSAEIESVDTDISTDAVADMPVAAADGDSAVPPPFLFGKPKRAPTGQSADAESAEGNAAGNNVEKLDVAEELQDRYMDNECGSGAYPSLAADPDFNALLEDIATGPLNSSATAAGSKPPAAAAGSEAAAAAAAAPRKTPAKLKPNPLRGFLSRRLLSPQAPAAAEPPPTPKLATAADTPAPKSPQAEQQTQLQPQPPPQQQQQQQQQQEEPERAPSGDGSERALEQEEKDVAQDERLQQQEEDSQEVLGLAMGWLQGMYSNGARESLPANAAFDRIAALLPGAPLCPHQLVHTLQLFICSFSTTC
jgi:hypothetical protein